MKNTEKNEHKQSFDKMMSEGGPFWESVILSITLLFDQVFKYCNYNPLLRTGMSWDSSPNSPELAFPLREAIVYTGIIMAILAYFLAAGPYYSKKDGKEKISVIESAIDMTAIVVPIIAFFAIKDFLL